MSKVDQLKRQMRASANSSRNTRASTSPYLNEIEEMIEEMVKEPEKPSEEPQKPVTVVELAIEPSEAQKTIISPVDAPEPTVESIEPEKEQESATETSSTETIVKDSLESVENLEIVDKVDASETIETVEVVETQLGNEVETQSKPVELAQKESQLVVTQKVDRVLEIKPFKSTELISWGALLSEEASDTLSYYAAVHSLNAYIVVNSIISSEMEWENAHPEFPSKDFVMSNIKAKRSREVVKISRSLTITEEHRSFVKTASIRCGMKMQEFMEYLIMEYLSEKE